MEDIQDHIVNFYMELFGTEDEVVENAFLDDPRMEDGAHSGTPCGASLT